MHRLQQHILTELATHDGLRYARLKPDEVEGNAFMYHLRQLIKAGYIAHTDEHYRLTAEGKLYVDRVRLKSFTTPLQPKIVILIHATNEQGQTLLYERSRQPLIHMTGLPYGKLHAAETLEQAAARELRKKSGYEADFSYHCSGISRISEGGELTSYILFILVCATNLRGQLLPEYRSGRAYWANPVAITPNKLIPTTTDMLGFVGRPAGGFYDLSYDLPA